MNILLVGEGCKDIFHYGRCNRLCPAAPVPVFESVQMTETGGMAKNVQENLTSLGATVNMITNKTWEKISKTRYVELDSNHMFLRVDKNDDSYGKMNLHELEKINFSLYDGVVVSDYNKGFLNEECLKYISLSHKLTFLDTKKILGPWAENFSFIKINNKEYENTKHTINTKLKNKIIRTCGSGGAVYQEAVYPVSSVEVKDTSGAGDTFISAFCYNYIKSNNIIESVLFANECSTKVVQKRGVSTI